MHFQCRLNVIDTNLKRYSPDTKKNSAVNQLITRFFSNYDIERDEQKTKEIKLFCKAFSNI